MADVAENAAFTDPSTAISHGKRHLLVRDYTMAVTALAQACQLLAEKHGDTADELGEPYLLYGRALLGLAREEAGVLGGGVPGTEDAEEEEEDEEEEAEDEKLSNVDEKEEEDEEMKEEGKEGKEGKAESASETKEEKTAKIETAEEKTAEPQKVEEKKKEEKEEEGSEKAEKEKSKEAEKVEKKKSEEAGEEKKSEEAEKAEKKNSEEAEKAEKKKSEEAEKAEEKSEAEEEKNVEAEKAEEKKEKAEEKKEKEEEKKEKEEEKKEKQEEKKEKEEEKVMPGSSKGSHANGPSCSSGQNGDVKENGEDSEDIGKEDEEDEVNNLQVAWEVLELAKLVLLKRGPPGWKLLADAYRLLGEVAMEGGNFQGALSDLHRCLNLLQQIDPQEPRAIAEIHYQLALAHSLGNEFDASIDEFNKATELLEARIKELEEIKEPPKSEDSFYTVEGEIQELKELLPEIREKISDMKDFKQEACKLVIEGIKSKVAGGCSNGAGPSGSEVESSKTQKPASDISHLVRKKRKADEPETEAASPAKKPTPEKV